MWNGRVIGGVVRGGMSNYLFFYVLLAWTKRTKNPRKNDGGSFMFFWLAPKEPKGQGKMMGSAIFPANTRGQADTLKFHFMVVGVG